MPGARVYLSTALTCLIFTLVVAQKHCGIGLLLAAPFMAVWMAATAWSMWRKPAQRRVAGVKMLMWTVVLLALACVHGYYARAARAEAQQAVAAVLAYGVQHQGFPASLAAAGIDQTGLKKRWMLAYTLDRGKPVLFYASTFMPFETISFDFERGAWRDGRS